MHYLDTTPATVEEWQACRAAIEEYADKIKTKPSSCDLFETTLDALFTDTRVQKLELARYAITMLNTEHPTHDDFEKHTRPLNEKFSEKSL